MNGSTVRWRAYDMDGAPLCSWGDWASVAYYYYLGAAIYRTAVRGEKPDDVVRI